MGKRIAISQSNYIPWKGYFDLIDTVDAFVLYDDVQYTRRDWRNRNRIKTANGPLWLTVPVQVKGKYTQKICDVVVSEPDWGVTHWRSLEHAYRRAPHFAAYEPHLRPLYENPPSERLSAINRAFLEAINRLLGITTPFTWSSDYQLEDDRNQRLISICRQAGATDYYSGPAAKTYLDEAAFAAEGIRVHWMEYDGYPEYPQLHPPFDPYVTVLDLLFHVGAEAPRYIKRSAGGAAAA
ncbi:MAG: WbqC family protein [Gemmataceae bacterium]